MSLISWFKGLFVPADKRLVQKIFDQSSELAILRARVKVLSDTIDGMSKTTVSPLEMRRTVKDFQGTIHMLEEKLRAAEHFKETVSTRLQSIHDKLDHYLKQEEILAKKTVDAKWPVPVGERPRQHNQD